MPKRRKNSNICSSGPADPPALGLAFSKVRMFTTDGPTASTKSVKSGKPRTNGAPWAQALDTDQGETAIKTATNNQATGLWQR
jgi:hypothetical protein